LKINRFTCLYRFASRYFKYRGTHRPDITEGCLEKIDIEIVKYILWDYHNKRNERQKLFNEAKNDNKNVIILSGIKNINKWIKKHI